MTGRMAERKVMGIRVCLEDILKDRGMTSKELCKLVNITEANLSVLRSGKAKGVRFHTMNRICYFLQCDVGDILKFDGNLEEESYGRNNTIHAAKQTKEKKTQESGI